MWESDEDEETNGKAKRAERPVACDLVVKASNEAVRRRGEETSAIVTVSHVEATSGGIPGVQSLEVT